MLRITHNQALLATAAACAVSAGVLIWTSGGSNGNSVTTADSAGSPPTAALQTTAAGEQANAAGSPTVDTEGTNERQSKDLGTRSARGEAAPTQSAPVAAGQQAAHSTALNTPPLAAPATDVPPSVTAQDFAPQSSATVSASADTPAERPAPPTTISALPTGNNLSGSAPAAPETPASIPGDSGPALATSETNAEAPAASADNLPPRVFTWSSVPDQSGIMVPMLRIDGRISPALAGEQAQRLWKDRPVRERAILLFLFSKDQEQAVDAPLNELITDGFDFEEIAAYWEDVLATLHRRGLTPGRVVLDFEDGITIWHFNAGRGLDATANSLAAAWDDPQSKARLPEYLRGLDPRTTRWFYDREATIAWNHFARREAAANLRRAFAEPLWTRFPEAQITNYNDADYLETQISHTGWPIPISQVGRGTSPVLYSIDSDANTELVRQCYLATTVAPAPWVAFPSWRNDRAAFAKTVRGAYSVGVRDFLYWNADVPKKLADDDAFALEIFGSLAPSSPAFD